MAKGILMEEFHVSLFVPRGLQQAECAAVRRALDESRFRAALGRAVRAVLRRSASLDKVTVKVTQ